MQNVIGRENKNKSDLKQKRYERCYEATTPCESMDRRVRAKTNALVMK